MTKAAITRRTALALTLAATAAGRATATGSGSLPATRTDEPEPPVDPAIIRPLAYNLSGLTDWNTSRPFLNLVRQSRGIQTGFDGSSHEGLRRAGHLDANGYPVRIPPGTSKVETIWDWNVGADNAEAVAERAGRYVFRWEGEGTPVVGGASVVSRQADRVMFDWNGRGILSVGFTAMTAGNHPRNWVVCKESELTLVDRGEVFRPEYLAIIKRAGLFRTMNWGNMNLDEGWSGTGPDATHPWFGKWDQRPLPGDVTYSVFQTRGVPIEAQVRLANDAGTGLWLNIPHVADETYIRSAARLVRDTLDPSLEARPEHGNEMWNFAFRAGHWLAARSRAEFGAEDYWAYSAYAQTRTALIWKEEWAAKAGPKPKLVLPLAVQAANAWAAGYMLNSTRGGIPAPRTVFDEVAITSYFGGAEIGDATRRADLIARIRSNPATARTWLRDQLLAPGYPGSIPEMEGFLTEQRAEIAKAAREANRRVRMVAYEGGSHVHHLFTVDVPEADLAVLTPWMAEFSYSQEMADLYRAWAAMWERFGEGPHMEYTEVEFPSKWGSWASRRYISDENPRARFVDTLGARPVWWA